MELNERFENTNFIERCPEYYYNYLYFHSGLYYKQIKRYLDRFPRDQLHFIVFEEFVSDTVREVQNVFHFLGVNSSFLPDIRVHNEGAGVRFPKLQYLVKQYVARFPIPGIKGLANFLMKINKIDKVEPIDAELRKKLKELYVDDIIKTEKLIKINLTNYWL
jgi:hypothetical protein